MELCRVEIVVHAARDDVDDVLMRRQRSVGSRADLELARSEIPWPWAQMGGGVAFAVPLLAVALRTVFEVEPLARLPLCLGTDGGTLSAHRSSERRAERGDEHG